MSECSIQDHIECCKVSTFEFPQFIHLFVPCFQFVIISYENLCEIHGHMGCFKVCTFEFSQFIHLSIPCFQFVLVSYENIIFYYCLVNLRTAWLLHNETDVDAMLKCTLSYMENSVSHKGYTMNVF